EIEGAWIRICCRLWWSETPGSLEMTPQTWAKLLGKNRRSFAKLCSILEANNIGNIEQNNGLVRITSRRMVKDEIIRKKRKESGKLGGNPALILDNQNNDGMDNQKSTPSSSSSSSSSKIIKEAPSLSPPKIKPKDLTFEGFFETKERLEKYQELAISIIQKYKTEFSPGRFIAFHS